MFSVDRIDTAESFASFAGAWAPPGAGGAPGGNVFLSHPWLSAWWDAYRDGRSLRALAATNGTGAAAVLPLVAEKGPWGARRLVLMGSGEVAPNHLDVVAPAGAGAGLAEAFCEALWRRRGEWDVLDLVSVGPESVLGRDLPEAFVRRGCDVRVSLYARCAVAELPASFEAFLMKLGQGTRCEFRRKRRKLLRDVPSARFARVETEAERQRVFGEMVRLHQARWTRLGETGAFASRRFEAFHRAASADLLARGWLRLYYLEAEGKVVSALYCFRAGRSVYYYAGGFDEAWKKHSVGVQTLAYSIEQSIAEGAAEFDFLQGDEDYKSHWCTGWREDWRVAVAAPHLRGKLVGWSTATGDRLLSLWRKHLPLETRRKIKGLLRRRGAGGARIEDRG